MVEREWRHPSEISRTSSAWSDDSGGLIWMTEECCRSRWHMLGRGPARPASIPVAPCCGPADSRWTPACWLMRLKGNPTVSAAVNLGRVAVRLKHNRGCVGTKFFFCGKTTEEDNRHLTTCHQQQALKEASTGATAAMVWLELDLRRQRVKH